MLDKSTLGEAKNLLDKAVERLRNADREDHIPRGLLVRACYYRFQNSMKLAKKDLQEVYNIVQRGGMLLFLCDYHLESARLACSVGEEVLGLSASEHVEKAKALIAKTGYKRRLPEVEYLEEFMANA